MSRQLNIVVLLLFLFESVLANALFASEQPKSEAVGALQMRLSQCSNDPLPLQACRLRLVVKNRSARPVGGLAAALPLYFSVQGPEDRELKRVHDGILSLGQERSWTGSGGPARDRTFRLEQGEEISITFSLAVDWRADGFNRAKQRHLFPTSGSYVVQVLFPIQYPAKHPLRYDPSRFLRAQITIEVQRPKGDDEMAFMYLRDHPDTVYAMLSTIGEPHARIVPRLEQLVKQFPKSTYADYARWALARKQLRGTGFVSLGYREKFERFADGFTTLLTAKNESDDSLQELLTEELNGEGAEVIRQLVKHRWRPPEELTKLLRAYYELLHVSVTERRSAIALLRQIGSDPGFAYYPNVLCSLKFALKGLDPMSLKLIDQEMSEKYYDTKEWIAIQGGLIARKDRDAWRSFRVRKTDSKAESP